MNFEIPENLLHKPVIKVTNYWEIDGKYINNSDAKGLSLGFAQYDSDQISAKVWRHSDLKWSRQSEELPLNRVLDLALLILKTKLFFEKENIKEENEIKKYPFLPSGETTTIILKNIGSFKDMFQEYDRTYLSERILELKKTIEELEKI